MNPIWWMGVVENRKDPLGLGRCQVRIFGDHSENKLHIPTEDLPWANVLETSDSFKPPFEGDWVFGFYMDGNQKQFPSILGKFPGIPSEFANNQKGFNDPRTSSDLQNAPQYLTQGPHSYPRYIDEPSTSRAYRNENVNQTVIGTINSSLTKNVSSADGTTWNQPSQSYNAEPPYNSVKETESGHLMEFDDTPGSERIQIAHKTGTYEEIRPDGSKVTKIIKDNYSIIVGNDYVNIQGTCSVTINGNANLLVNGNSNMSVNGTYTAKAQQFIFEGPIQTTSTITAAGDVVGAGISLDHHVHPYGASTTLQPE